MNFLKAFKHPLALLGLLLVGGWVLMALFAPCWRPTIHWKVSPRC